MIEEEFNRLVEKAADYLQNPYFGWKQGKYFWYKHENDDTLSEEEELKILKEYLDKESL